jgi:CTP:molybdopterin cytidylyltransferase MocA
MASSLLTGLALLDRFSLSLDGALIGVCDQPHFSTTVIAKLVASITVDKTIASARYGGRLGVPALFSRVHFKELRTLKGAEGARQILAAHGSEVAAVDFPELAIDVDTPADYESLLDQKPAP